MASTTLNLPGGSVSLRDGPPPEASEAWNRVAFAAAHVVADPLEEGDPWVDCAIDWDRTLAFREYLWSLGFGVAEAMDTAQRGMGLDWPTSMELIRRSVAAARAGGHRIASGAGTDHLSADARVGLDAVIAAYEEQCEAVEAVGSQVILMASRALVKVARGPDDYARVYEQVLGGLERPAILHWLGEMFDPCARGLLGRQRITGPRWKPASGSSPTMPARSTASRSRFYPRRRRLRCVAGLPDGIRMYTGDDFNYPDLIAGDDRRSIPKRLLGIFDPIAGAAARALSALGAGDRTAYDAAFGPTVPLSRHIFRAPTRFYKTGVVFMAYLNGHQDHFVMVGGQESARSTLHLAEIIRLANAAGLFPDAEMTAARARPIFAGRGVEV